MPCLIFMDMSIDGTPGHHMISLNTEHLWNLGARMDPVITKIPPKQSTRIQNKPTLAIFTIIIV